MENGELHQKLSLKFGKVMLKRIVIIVALFFGTYVLTAQDKNPIYHTIKQNETFSKIASKHNIRIQDLEVWNEDVNPNQLQVGQKIIIGWQEVSTVEVEEPRINADSVELGKVSISATQDEQEISPAVSKTRTPKNIVKTEKGNNAESHRFYGWFWLFVGLLMGGCFGIIFYKFLYVNKLHNELKQTTIDLDLVKDELQEMKGKFNEIMRLKSRVQSLEKEKRELVAKNASLLEENVTLGENIDSMKETLHVEATQHATEEQSIKSSNKQPKNLYAETIVDDYFVKVSDTPTEDSIFVLNMINENEASFTIYTPAYQRVIANPAFLEGCDKQILAVTMQIDIDSKGTARRDFSNGKWKVINKLNVIIR